MYYVNVKLFNLIGGIPKEETGALAAAEVLTKINEYVGYVTKAVIIICTLLVVVWVVNCGIKLAKAEDAQSQKNAREQLTWTLIALLAIMPIMAIMQAPDYNTMITTVNPFTDSTIPDNKWGSESLKNAFAIMVVVVKSVLLIVTNACAIFILWVCWGLAKAEDENQRRDAKKHIVWVGIGLCVIFLIAFVATKALK